MFGLNAGELVIIGSVLGFILLGVAAVTAIIVLIWSISRRSKQNTRLLKEIAEVQKKGDQ